MKPTLSNVVISIRFGKLASSLQEAQGKMNVVVLMKDGRRRKGVADRFRAEAGQIDRLRHALEDAGLSHGVGAAGVAVVQGAVQGQAPVQLPGNRGEAAAVFVRVRPLPVRCCSGWCRPITVPTTCGGEWRWTT